MQEQKTPKKNNKKKSASPPPALIAPPNAKVYRDVFNAIVSFVNDLNDAFGQSKKITPLALYHRLIQNLKTGDHEGIAKAVNGFKIFLRRYELALIKNDIGSIPEGTTIKYGDSERICIEIQKYFYRSRNQEETLAVIRQHLLTIATIINPSSDANARLAELENAQKERDAGGSSVLPGIDTSTKEGRFINDILETAKNGMEGIDTNDPMTAMMGVYKSGALQKMMAGMNDGSMNPRSLGRMMKKTLNALIPDDPEDEVKPSSDVPVTPVTASETPNTNVEQVD